jgi:hypothetical protein
MMEARGRFVPTYSPELAQYVVVRGEVRVVPTKAHPEDDAHVRATVLATRLNKLYAEPTPERMVPGVACPVDGCRYPGCGCPLASVPTDRWVCRHDTCPNCKARGFKPKQGTTILGAKFQGCEFCCLADDVERLREADGAELADEGEV